MNVALFVTCLTDTFFPRAGEAVVHVLRHFGCRVQFPEQQTCCGQPAYNSGFHHEAAELARRFIDIFEPYETIVSPSASCTSMVHHYPDLLAAEPRWRARAERVAARTFEFATFLERRLEVDLAAHLRFDEAVTYHYPCHARGIYEADDLKRWLGQSAGSLLRPPQRHDLCCGFGGTFAVDYPDISGTMLNDKLAQLTATGASLVVSSEAGCTMQIAGGARRRGHNLRFKHLAECLAESLGLMEPE